MAVDATGMKCTMEGGSMKSNQTCFNAKPRFLAILAGAMCLALAAGAGAEEAKPCAADAKKFCKGVQPGEGRIVKCMREHESELSPACKAKIAEGREEIKEAAEACKQDIQRNCKDVQPGGGRIVQCLKAHESTLSPQCREKLEQAGRRRR